MKTNVNKQQEQQQQENTKKATFAKRTEIIHTFARIQSS